MAVTDTSARIIISSNRILTYNKPDFIVRDKKGRKDLMKELLKKRHKGNLGMPAIKKITKIVDTWNTYIHTAKEKRFNYKKNMDKKLSLITLTLSASQKNDDKEIKRNLLNRFIIEMQRKKQIINYLWKAEYQKNGNIHFHIVVDKFIEWQWIRSTWNNIQKVNGYLDEYYEKFQNYDPNSTDIHACKNVKNVRKYICKYLTKKGEERENAGRVWGCSDSVREISPVEMIMSKDIELILNKLEQKKDIKVSQNDYCTVFYGEIIKELKKADKDFYQEYVEQLFMICFDI